MARPGPAGLRATAPYFRSRSNALFVTVNSLFVALAFPGYLANHLSEFPISYPEDYVLSRSYRCELEAKGFRWVPESLAWRFSFERTRLYSRTFGFHGHFNWPYVLPAAALQERIALASQHVRAKFFLRK